MSPLRYLCESARIVSIRDLLDIKAGTLTEELRAAVQNCDKHITKECILCQARGSYCELCRSDQLIFPFSTNTTQCKECKSLFHSTCVNDEHRAELANAHCTANSTPHTHRTHTARTLAHTERMLTHLLILLEFTSPPRPDPHALTHASLVLPATTTSSSAAQPDNLTFFVCLLRNSAQVLVQGCRVRKVCADATLRAQARAAQGPPVR
jgi:hypothetical protein